MRVAVAIDAPQHAGLGSLLTYESEQSLAPGTLVRVPLGRREVTGLVWDADFAALDAATAAAPEGEEPPPIALRSVIEALASLPPLPADWRALVEFTARYYQRSLGGVSHLRIGWEHWLVASRQNKWQQTAQIFMTKRQSHR